MSATKVNNRETEDLSVSSGSEDDFLYEEVSVEDEWSLSEGEEDLEATLRAIKDRAEATARADSSSHRAQAVDEFLRSFLLQEGLTETLDCYQTEWTEMVQKGLLAAERVGAVPSVYTENQLMERELRNAVREREELRIAAANAAEALRRLRRARDFHRRQQQRVVQERNKVLQDMRRLKGQCDSCEPEVKRMSDKYQAAVRQTLLVTVRRDRALAQLDLSEETRTGTSSASDQTSCQSRSTVKTKTSSE